MELPKGNNEYYSVFSHCAEWANGEGYDWTLLSEDKEQRFSTHLDELDVMFACLMDLKYFKTDD